MPSDCPSNAVVLPRFNGLIRGLAAFALAAAVIFGALEGQVCGGQVPLRWRWSNPVPFGGDIYDMAYGLGLTVAVTERGGIHTSEDLLFWEPRESYTTNALRAVTFFNERLVITGERGTFLYADSLYDFRLGDLGTEDWLEGVACSTNLLVAVGDNGAIYTSASGSSWSQQVTLITNWLAGVAYGQGTFVAVGSHGFVASSLNGTNWTKRSSGTTRYLYRVGWLQNQFWAVGEAGLLLASANGVNWTPVSNQATGALYGATGTVESQAAVGEGELRLRGPGTTWSSELDPAKPFPAPRWTYYNALWEGSLYLVSGRSGMMVEGFQTNVAGPFLWVDRARPLRNWLWELYRSPDFYITVGYRGTVMTSENGIDWHLELVPASVTNVTLLGVGGTTNLLLAVGGRGALIISPNTFTNLISTNLDGSFTTNLTSTLGIFWQALPPPTTNDLQAVTAWGEEFVIAGDNGTILTSGDGTNWTRRSTPSSSFLTGLAAHPGGLVAVGRSGTLLTSSDGQSWTNRPSGTTNWLYRARYLGGRLIVVGQNGTILTSVDGVNWAAQSSPTSKWLNDVALLEDTYYIVGTQGTVLASSNALDWASVGTITDKSLYGVAGQGGQLVVAGVEGVILRSPVVPKTAPVQILNFSQRDQQNLFLLVGEPDQRFTLERSLNLTQWVKGPTLEFLDSSGTLLFLEGATTNLPPEQFYRATPTP